MTPADAAIIGGIIAAVYAAIQIGDRLWLKKSTGSEQPQECRYEHAKLNESTTETTRLLRELVSAQTSLLQAMESQAKLQYERHQELLRALDKGRGG